MRINYSGTLTQRKIKFRSLDIDMKEAKKIEAIRALLYKHNLQAYKGDVGKEVREALEANTIEEYRKIMVKLRSPRLGNVLIDYKRTRSIASKH